MRQWFLLWIAGLLLVSLPAWAQPKGPTVLALIVTNNRSLELGRPELRFADDDGAKYFDLFRSVAPEQNLRLLTDMDRDTRALFPHLERLTQRPSKARLLAAAKDLAARAREEQKQGHPVDFYFAFAGHGDVDEGMGFVELTDGRFSSADLEKLIELFPKARVHVLIDSCNSYFLINSRKPGGHRFATPDEAAQKLARRFPNVGVFLSTSSEAEVYEWSELQSGIFSHAVRSGLSGAADLNRDGRVSYAELSGFVGVAASRVKNPLYRPQVFARGPKGEQSGVLLDLNHAQGTRLEVGGDQQKRITLRDANDVPRIDAHNEKGTALSLVVPDAWRVGAEVNEYRVGSSEISTLVARYALRAASDGNPNPDTPVVSLPPAPDQPQRLAMASLPSLPESRTSRGPGQIFGRLFARPYGPGTLAEFELERAKEPEPIYGVTQDDLNRMKLILDQVAGQERGQRQVVGGIFGVLGLSTVTLGVPLVFNRDRATREAGWGVLALGGPALAFSGYKLAVLSNAEKLAQRFDERLGQSVTPEAQAALVADTERGLRKEADKHRSLRLTLRWAGGLTAAVSFSLLVANEFIAESNDTKDLNRFTFGYMGGLGLVNLAASFNPTPTERMVRLWEADPGRVRMHHSVASSLKWPSLHWGVAPQRGGALFGLSGAF